MRTNCFGSRLSSKLWIVCLATYARSAVWITTYLFAVSIQRISLTGTKMIPFSSLIATSDSHWFAWYAPRE